MKDGRWMSYGHSTRRSATDAPTAEGKVPLKRAEKRVFEELNNGDEGRGEQPLRGSDRW